MTGLLDLQQRQQEHDRDHHRDIYTLPYPERMNHYVLHFSKYVGRLSRDYAEEEQLEAQLKKTLADSFIVALAAANTLNLNLQNELEEMFGLEETELNGWAAQLNSSDETMGLEELQDWWFERMATPTGRMANALESLDHMEPVNVREILEEDTVEVISNLLIVSDNLLSDLDETLNGRWTEIEEHSIL